ncbi:MAG: tripartite tricarboxylate transporter substrate-binding protein [Sulfuritalea sp.]|nr:tripartite tricarboxylate transporter substrate-binding protein [Sulfuritalea sp.]
MVARIVAEKLAQLWGQPVAVENRSIGVTVPGVDAVAKSKPDGYTLLAHSISFAVDAGLYTNLPYAPEKDFVAIAPFARQPFALVAAPSLGAKSVADLVAKAKAGPLKFASLGTTTQVYFIAEQFKKQAGVDAANVSYKSLAESNAAVAKGEAAFWFPPVAGAMAGIREGKLVALAVTGEKRSAMLPQVPTMAEAGVRNMESAAWFGMWAPAGVPSRVVDKIAKDVERALQSPDVLEKLAKMGAEPMSMTPSQFARFIRGETDASKRFVSELGIKPQQYIAPAKQ